MDTTEISSSYLSHIHITHDYITLHNMHTITIFRFEILACYTMISSIGASAVISTTVVSDPSSLDWPFSGCSV